MRAHHDQETAAIPEQVQEFERDAQLRLGAPPEEISGGRRDNCYVRIEKRNFLQQLSGRDPFKAGIYNERFVAGTLQQRLCISEFNG